MTPCYSDISVRWDVLGTSGTSFQQVSFELEFMAACDVMEPFCSPELQLRQRRGA